jgi:hypothetical protein
VEQATAETGFKEGKHVGGPVLTRKNKLATEEIGRPEREPSPPSEFRLSHFPKTLSQVSRWRGGRFAWARLVAACISQRSCPRWALGVLSFRAPQIPTINRPGGIPEKSNPKVPEHHSIHVRAASAATSAAPLKRPYRERRLSRHHTFLRGAFPIGVSRKPSANTI